jgi:hypothetical protein
MALRGHCVTVVPFGLSLPFRHFVPALCLDVRWEPRCKMATIGLVSLTERLLNQTAGQAQEPQTATQSRTTANNGAFAATEDPFTPSAPNAAQTAGLFTVSQSTLFSPAAEFLLAQPPDPPAGPLNTPAPAAANFTAPPAAQEATAINTAAPVSAPDAAAATVAIGTPAPPSATATNGGAVSTAANAAATTSANAQHQLRLLNNALAALGLNSTDIQKIDSIAGVIGDFQPTRFPNLAFELQALAQQSAPQAVPQAFPPAAPQGTLQTPPAAGTIAAGAAAANAPGSTAANTPATSAASATEPGRP